MQMAVFQNIQKYSTDTEFLRGLTAAIIPESDILRRFDKTEYTIFPGFCDVHVHFREPGFSYKGTIYDGSRAAARGGYTVVCAMPNLNPVPDSVEHLQQELDLIKKDACIEVYPYAAITVGEAGQELADLEGLAPLAIAFSDDGRGIQDEEMMRAAMIKAKSLGKMIVAHCEVNDLLHGGYIHDGEYAKLHGHRGICSESEWGEIARDVRLAEETGCAYHVCHVSAKESVQIIREAKARGVNVTCETGPHYLLMNDMDLQEDGRFKMNPPIRSEEDRLALIEGIKDGTIDMIITDHAPHSAEEKSRGLEKSAMGVVGLETAFAALYGGLVKTGVISLEMLLDLMVYAPRRRFGIPLRENDFCIWDLNAEYTVDPAEFLSKGRATPFEGRKVCGRCLATVCGGKIVWMDPAVG
ncbi:MAG: dihydroorotase [Eubacterium sp.]|nr:dihydroorotase [Lachnospiraceae bacterium]MBR2189427.1 dihydroorotase [Eubacterium sp.]